MGRGNAVMVATVFCLVVVAFQIKVAHARTYVVGDAGIWTFDVSNWTNDKKFNAGDVLVFNYLEGVHNVAVVNQTGLENCSVIPGNAKVYTSGHDRITLAKGSNYFICSISSHCTQGMKIIVNAV